MKLLLISNENMPNVVLKNILSNSSIEFQEVLLNQSEFLDSKIVELLNGVNSIIFDRIYFPIKNFIELLSNKDCYFIVDSLTNLNSFGEIDENFTMKIYFSPLNFNLLINDIKSISKIKDYIDFGEIKLDALKFNLNKRSLIGENEEIFLKNKEFELLLFLIKNKGRILSRTTILEEVWDMNSKILTNTVDVHVSRLRKILFQYFGLNNIIKTIPCVGYILL